MSPPQNWREAAAGLSTAAPSERAALLRDLDHALATAPAERRRQIAGLENDLRSAGIDWAVVGASPALVLDPASRRATRNGEVVGSFGRAVTAFRLLEAVATDGPSLDRAGLYARVWQQPFSEGRRNAVMVAVSRLRVSVPTLAIATRDDGGYHLEPQPSVVILRDPLQPAPEPEVVVLTPFAHDPDVLRELDAAVQRGLVPAAAVATPHSRALLAGRIALDGLGPVAAGLDGSGVDAVSWAVGCLSSPQRGALDTCLARGAGAFRASEVGVPLELLEELWKLGMVERFEPRPGGVALRVPDPVRAAAEAAQAT